MVWFIVWQMMEKKLKAKVVKTITKAELHEEHKSFRQTERALMEDVEGESDDEDENYDSEEYELDEDQSRLQRRRSLRE